MALKLRIGAITDEYDPVDLARALQAMMDTGMAGVELRMVYGKNIMNLSDGELETARAEAAAKGLEVVSIASPLLKCVLPDSPAVDERFQHDIFASQHTFEDQPALARKALRIARMMGARIVRVFSYWRTVAPERCFERIVEALRGLADQARQEDLIIGLENEHACNIATAAEAARVLQALDHPNLKLVWDPANALCAGENPFPSGYRRLDASRIVHVHAKDCRMEGHKPLWGPLGTQTVDWKGQIEALLADGYAGYIHLETHWSGPGDNKFLASVICGENLKGLVAA